MTILSNCRMVPDLTEGYSGNYADIVYENGLIEGIYPVGMAPSPEGTEVLDIKGMNCVARSLRPAYACKLRQDDC